MNYFPILRAIAAVWLAFSVQLYSINLTFFRGIFRFRFILALTILIAVIFSPPLTLLATSPVANANAGTASQSTIVRSDAETYYGAVINNMRAENGLPPLIVDTRLSLSAAQKSADMIARSYWGHYAPSGNSFSDFVWADSPNAERVGENLARCYDNRQDAFAALKASPTHYAIMNDKFSDFGVAEAIDPATGCTLTTMHFSYYL